MLLTIKCNTFAGYFMCDFIFFLIFTSIQVFTALSSPVALKRPAALYYCLRTAHQNAFNKRVAAKVLHI